MTPDALQAFLTAADQGADVPTLCSAFDLGQTRAYELLREYRPDRPRKARRRTSAIPAKVLALHEIGTPAKRIALLLGVTPVYVWRILKSVKVAR
jgi:hypothetical protein